MYYSNINALNVSRRIVFAGISVPVWNRLLPLGCKPCRKTNTLLDTGNSNCFSIKLLLLVMMFCAIVAVAVALVCGIVAWFLANAPRPQKS